MNSVTNKVVEIGQLRYVTLIDLFWNLFHVNGIFKEPILSFGMNPRNLAEQMSYLDQLSVCVREREREREYVCMWHRRAISLGIESSPLCCGFILVFSAFQFFPPSLSRRCAFSWAFFTFSWAYFAALVKKTSKLSINVPKACNSTNSWHLPSLTLHTFSLLCSCDFDGGLIALHPLCIILWYY